MHRRFYSGAHHKVLSPSAHGARARAAAVRPTDPRRPGRSLGCLHLLFLHRIVVVHRNQVPSTRQVHGAVREHCEPSLAK